MSTFIPVNSGHLAYPPEDTIHTKCSILIPAFNEEKGIAVTLQELLDEPRLKGFEIIVVNDGSSDLTGEVIKGFPTVTLLTHRKNRGYGASIKTAVKKASGKFVFWFDADGQHRAEDVVRIADRIIGEDLDYCIGIRDDRSHVEKGRIVGKFILKHVVSIAAGQEVKDFNSGLRAFKRTLLLQYIHLLPERFGASTTTTLLMLCRDYIGDEVPIVVRKRIGKSSVKQLRDGLRTILLTFRIFIMFKPILFFGSIGAFFIVIGSIYGFLHAFLLNNGFPVLSAIVISVGVQSLFFGILADQLSSIRIERLENGVKHE